MPKKDLRTDKQRMWWKLLVAAYAFLFVFFQSLKFLERRENKRIAKESMKRVAKARLFREVESIEKERCQNHQTQ